MIAHPGEVRHVRLVVGVVQAHGAFVEARHPVEQADRARHRPPEIRVRLAADWVQGHQPGIAGGHVKEFAAGVLGVGQPPVQEAVVGRNAVVVGLAVVDPEGLARGCVDGGHLAKRSAGVEHPVDHQRGGLEHRVLHAVDVVVRRRPAPRHFELGRVVLVDLA